MKKKRLATSIAAVALAVATIFTGSNLPSVKAADVADKTVMELGGRWRLSGEKADNRRYTSYCKSNGIWLFWRTCSCVWQEYTGIY